MKIILGNVQRIFLLNTVLSVPSSWRGEGGEEDSLSNIEMQEVEDCVVRTDAQLGHLVGGHLLLPVTSLS